MPEPLVFLILGLPIVGAYAIYATGIVAIYRASRVLNLAHGAMATVPAFVLYTLVVSWKVPMVLAVPTAVATGAILGVAIERIFVRRLRPVSSTAQTVGTAAAFALLVALTARIWGTGGLPAPRIFPAGHLNVGASKLQYGQIGLLGVAVLVTVGLELLLHRTSLGLAMRAAAVNRRAALLMGIDPDRTAAITWAIGGALAATAGILLAAVTTLHPYSLAFSALPAFVAALIGGLESVSGALVGSLVVGLLVGFVPYLGSLPGFRLVLGQVGGVELTLAVAAMIVMALRGSRLSVNDVRGHAPAPARASTRPSGAGRRRPALAVLGIAALAAWVWLPGVPFSVLGDAGQALLYGLIAVSLILLTGWVGQISLAQAAFVGIGAYGTAFFARHAGVPFPFTLLVGAAAASLTAVLLGVVALRVRGLYLAVATLVFGWMADSYLFGAAWFSGSGGSVTLVNRPIGFKGGFPYFDVTDRRMFYIISLAALVLAIVAMQNLRRSKTGRALLALRGSEVAAASVGIDVTRYKLLAFATSGAIAGIAGSLIASNQQTIVPAQFAFTFSLFYLAIAVVGGTQSLPGGVAASVLFAGLGELFFRVAALRGWLEVTSASLLVGVLVFYPGGLAALGGPLADVWDRAGAAVRRRLERRGVDLGWVVRWGDFFRRETTGLLGELVGLATEARRAGRIVARAIGRAVPRRGGARGSMPMPVSGGANGAVPDALRSLTPQTLDAWRGGAVPRRLAADRESRPPVLEAAGVVVRFGGVVALDGVSLSVREGEVVGLIGPNGAGKTTMFNAMAGLVVPSEGRVVLRGEDITTKTVHERAARGVGRTFQMIQLSPELAALENLLIATHLRNDTGFLSHLAITARSAEAEEAARARGASVLRLLQLEDVADRNAGELPFGTLRMIELGRALVTGAPLLMLDEPASGLDSGETEKLADLLRFVSAGLGITILLIEHDVRTVMRLCDYVYVLDRGRLIAEGPPAALREDPVVIEAYLGGASETAP